MMQLFTKSIFEY